MFANDAIDSDRRVDMARRIWIIDGIWHLERRSRNNYIQKEFLF
jgi:hypothetical protein